MNTALRALPAVLLMSVFALAVRSGSPLELAGAFALLAIPLAILASALRPLIFPYALYILLVPFDNLLGAGSFGTITKILGGASTLALLLWCARTRRFAMPGPSTIPLLLLLTWIAASAFWAIDQEAAFAALPPYAGLVALYLAVAVAPLDAKTYRTMLGAVAVSGLIAAAYGTNAFFHDPSLRAQALVVRRLVLHAGDIIIDPNHFSDAMLFPAAILAMAALRERRVLVKILEAAGIALITVAIALSGSREGLVGLGAIALYYLWRSRYRLQVGLLVAAAGAATFATQSSIWLRFASALQTGGSGRTAIWAVGWEAFRHNWLFGYGIGNFTQVYDRYYLQVFQAYTNGWDSPAHNIVMHYLVETGIVGMLLLAWFLWEHFRMLRVIGKDHPLYDDRVMMEGAMLAIMLVALSIDLFHYKYAWLLFATLAQLRSIALTMRSTAGPLEQNLRTYAQPRAPASLPAAGAAAQRSS